MSGALVPQFSVKPSLLSNPAELALAQNPVTVVSGGGAAVGGARAFTGGFRTWGRFWPYVTAYPYYAWGGYFPYQYSFAAPWLCPPGTALSWDGSCRPYASYPAPYLSLYGFNPYAGYTYSYAPWMFGGWGGYRF